MSSVSVSENKSWEKGTNGLDFDSRKHDELLALPFCDRIQSNFDVRVSRLI